MKLTPKNPMQMSSVGANEWLIEGLIPSRSLVLLSASPKAGKSILAASLAVSLCANDDALGMHKTAKRGKVLLVALEDAENHLKQRLTGLAWGRGIRLEELENLHVVTPSELPLDQEPGRTALEDLISREKYDLVIIDNLSLVHGQAETNARAMTALMKSLKELKDRLNTSILLVAHDRKSGGSRGSSVRGTSAIWAVAEGLLHLRHDPKQDQTYLDRTFRNFGYQPEIPIHVWSSSGGSTLNLEERYSWSNLQEQAETRNSEATDADSAIRLPN